MKRRIEFRAEVTGFVDLEINESGQPTADPDGDMTDGEAAETAITTAIGQKKEVFVFGPNIEPAEVWFDDIDITIEGECEDE
jgi:hypothetical protein